MLYEAYERAFAGLPRPFAFLDLDFLDHNISFVRKNLNGKKIRIATKSIRSLGVLRYIAKKFPELSGWMTFSGKETLYLLENGFDNCLIGYPIFEEDEAEGIIKYIKEGRDIVFMIDSPDHWSWLNSLGAKFGVTVPVCIDINLSSSYPFLYFGTKRSSQTNISTLNDLLEIGKNFVHTRVAGLMGYEAQIAGVGDQPVEKWKRPVIPLLKKQSKKKIESWRKEAVQLLERKFGKLELVNGGGSGSLFWTPAQREVTEITVGSAFYNPGLFDQYPSLDLKPAAGYALRVTRKPEKDVIVCHGGGYTASGSLSRDKWPKIYLPEGLEYIGNEGPGEVQTPLKINGGDLSIEIGCSVYFRHAKAGEICERFHKLYAVRERSLVGEFITYRGDGQCFL